MNPGPSSISNTFRLHPKQVEAFNHLRNNAVTMAVYGGGISGGKSRLCAAFLIWSSLTYPGTRYLVARKRLTDLKNSVLVSIYDTADEMGIGDIVRAGHNQQANTITFPNGSVILLRQLDVSPTDPSLTEIGSMEFTAIVLDEASELAPQVAKVCLQRLRYKLGVNGITGKLLICTNPTKEPWLYRDIYLRWEEGTLPAHIKYIPCLVHENPFADPSYVATLTQENLGEAEYHSKVLGDWRYEVGSNDLFIESELIDACKGKIDGIDQKERVLSIDVASRSGSDSSVAMLFNGKVLVRCWTWKGKDTVELHREINAIIADHGVPMRNVIVDAIGVGQGLADLLRGCVQFKSNHSRLNNEGYHSLRDQMFFKAAELIQRGELRIKIPVDAQDQLIKELCAHKRYKTETNGLAMITPKTLVSRALGGSKSPDYADAFSMAMYAIAYGKRPMGVRVHRWT